MSNPESLYRKANEQDIVEGLSGHNQQAGTDEESLAESRPDQDGQELSSHLVQKPLEDTEIFQRAKSEVEATQIYGGSYYPEQLARNVKILEERKEELLSKQEEYSMAEVVELLMMGESAEYAYSSHYGTAVVFHPDFTADVYDSVDYQPYEYTISLDDNRENRPALDSFVIGTFKVVQLLREIVPNIMFGNLKHMGGIEGLYTSLNTVQAALAANGKHETIQTLLDTKGSRSVSEVLTEIKESKPKIKPGESQIS